VTIVQCKHSTSRPSTVHSLVLHCYCLILFCCFWCCRVYTIEVRGLAVNGEEVDDVDDDSFEGGTIVDSGTTAVIFPNDAFKKLRKEVRRSCSAVQYMKVLYST